LLPEKLEGGGMAYSTTTPPSAVKLWIWGGDTDPVLQRLILPLLEVGVKPVLQVLGFVLNLGTHFFSLERFLEHLLYPI
jgi:hypothetical protein